MALPKKDKKYKPKLPVCKFCGAICKHYSYACIKNPKNQCKYCGGTNHTSLMCLKKPRKPIRQESVKAQSKRTATSREWYRLNPPDNNGNWICYLQISPRCPRILTRETITLEHVKSKARHPGLKYDVNNLKPACEFCNKLKGSLDLEDLPLLGSIKGNPSEEVPKAC
jgi:5-methylcytosine-specific restriction endonuclease McrA